jgi:predicted RND superfamily exporter protein
VRSPDLFEASVLTSLRDRDAVFAAVEGVVDSSSLFRTPIPVAKKGVLTREAPLAEIPADPVELAAKREALLGNELIRGHFLNERGDAMVMLYFLPPEKAGRTDHARILARFEEILTKQPIDRLELTLVGVPKVKQQLQDHILWDLIYLTPVALLVVGAVIFLFFRSLLSVAIPLVTGALSAVATIGFMGHAGYEISVFLSTIVVLILVLGCAEDLHLLSEYLDELDPGHHRSSRRSPGAAAPTGRRCSSPRARPYSDSPRSSLHGDRRGCGSSRSRARSAWR